MHKFFYYFHTAQQALQKSTNTVLENANRKLYKQLRQTQSQQISSVLAKLEARLDGPQIQAPAITTSTASTNSNIPPNINIDDNKNDNELDPEISRALDGLAKESSPEVQILNDTIKIKEENEQNENKQSNLTY